MWNLANDLQNETSIYSCGGQAPAQIPAPQRGQPFVPTVGGEVRRICISGNYIMWAADESLPGELPGVPVGMVHMLDPQTMTTLPLKVSRYYDISPTLLRNNIFKAQYQWDHF